MPMEKTRSGLPAVGDVPWGTHFCQFYRTADDLADALVRFFKAGLDDNEQCLWVTSEPLRAEEARAALRRAAPDLDARLRSGQIEIVDSSDWYLRSGGEQDVDAVLNDWIARKERALALGYAGLRVSGNTRWIATREQWQSFADYEAKVHSCFHKHRLLAMCSYPLDRCTGADVMDVIRRHEFAILYHDGEWQMIESASLKMAKEELRKKSDALMAGQKRVLEMVATSAPLADTLAELTRFIEAQEEALHCGILIVGEDGAHFRGCIGPALPKAYHQALDGVPITPPYLGPCGEAAHRGEAVVVADIAADGRWAEAWRDLARSCGLAACRSTPVLASDGRVLASFAMYYDRPCAPEPAHPELIEIATHLAGIAIERKRAEEALRQSEERLAAELAASRRLQDISVELIQEQGAEVLYQKLVDAAALIMRSDYASMQMLHPERGERGELHLLAFRGFDPEAAKFWEWVRADSGCTCGQVLRTGRRALAADVETCDFMAGTDDRTAYLQAGMRAAQSTPLFSRSGRLLGMLSTHWRAPHEPTDGEWRLFDVLARQAADLIERVQAEAAVRDSEELFRTLADAIPQLAWIAGPDGAISWYNRGWYAYTGTTREEMEGWGWQSVHDPAVLPSVLERWRASLATGTPFEMVFPIRGADGTFRPFLTRVAPVRGADGRVARWFGTNTDITGQREIHDTLLRLADALEHEVEERTRALEAEMAERRKVEATLQQAQRLEAVGQLTGGVAHDFNNLLTVVVGQTDGILRIADGNEQIAVMAAAIQRAALRGARLTSQLLAFSRRQQLRPATMSLDRLMENVDDLVRRAVGETVDVEFRSAPALWPTLVDPTQFESALLNLAVNARDAMPAGGRLTIEMRNTAVSGMEALRLDLAPGDYVVVSVADTGIGMPPEVRERAFEPFFTTKDVGKGTGLGLAQIYGFAKQSGGAVAIESTMGHGATVLLYLPRAEMPAAMDRAPGREAAPAVGHGKTVLVVEDQSEVREVIEMSLAELGYRILTAPDGIDAQSVLESDETIDLLLTDIVMPNGVSGIDLAQAARRLRQDLKIVLVSGYTRDDQARANGLGDGFAFLEKPFRQAELAEVVATALGARKTDAAE